MHVQDDPNLCILHMFEDFLLLDMAYVRYFHGELEQVSIFIWMAKMSYLELCNIFKMFS